MIPSGSRACLIARSAWTRAGGARRADSPGLGWPGAGAGAVGPPAGGGELAELELADAVLGRDRASGGGDQVVHEARDLGAFAFVPVRSRVSAGADVEMDVAVAEMAEAGGDHSGECALDLFGRVDDEGG